MNVTLRQLRAFVAVARTGSFTVAAESLFITQSALSGLIKELEQSLGLRLFDRSTRRLQLSDVGRALQPQIGKILQDLDVVVGEVGNLKALRGGLVRVAVPQLLACTLLPEVMAEFVREYPDVRVRLNDCAVESVMSRVFAGEVDFGVGPEREPNSDIEARVLFESPFMAVLPPGHPLLAHKTLTWKDLAGDQLITLQGQFTERLAMDVGAVQGNTPLASSTEVVFMTTALSMVSAGLGVTVCLPYAVSLVERYGLHLRPVMSPVVSRRFYIFTRRGRALAPAAQAFHDFLVRQMEPLTGRRGSRKRAVSGFNRP